MFRELKQASAYSGTILLFSVSGAVFGILAGIFGEIFIPIAVPLLACLFIFERPDRRILSYCIPAVVLILSFWLSGIGAIAAAESVLCALIIALLYVKRVSKSEVAFYLTALMTVFLAVSLYIGMATQIGSFDFSVVMEFFISSFDTMKEKLTESMSAIVTAGVGQPLLTEELIDAYFDVLLKSVPAILAVSAFAMAGISLKIFSAVMRRKCKYGLLKKFSHFGVNNVIAYFYMIVAILSFFVGGKDAFGIAVINFNIVLVFVFAYIGLKYLLSLAEFTGRKPLIYTIIVASFLLFGATALRLISYVGLFVNISINRSASQFNSGEHGQGS